MRPSWLVLLSILVAAPVHAQEPANGPADPPQIQPTPVPNTILANGTMEWMVGAGPAWGLVVFHSAGGHKYLLQTVSWGRVLTEAHGPGLLRGRFELAFEVAPVYAQYSPRHTYGFGVTPLLWRWNFEPYQKLAPYAELAGGGLWTRDAVPERTTTSNFTAHGSYGVRYLLGPRHTINVAYRFHHISNGNRLERNPGVNAHVLMFGVSVLQP
jgi:lipid A 3-O-deacylase PagL